MLVYILYFQYFNVVICCHHKDHCYSSLQRFLKIFGGLLANPGNPKSGCRLGVWLLATAFGALIRSMKS